MCACLIIGFAFIVYVSYRLYQHFFPTPNINPNGKYVLISGSDSCGFGHRLAIELDRQGFNVLAGVLLLDSVTSLKSQLSPKATVFQLDITKQDDIDAIYDLVKSKTNTLHVLVNNAGITGSANIDWMSMEFIRKVMDLLLIERSKKPFSEFWLAFPSDVRERWSEDFLKAKENIFLKYAEDPIKGVQALQHAVMNTAPHIRYRPRWQSDRVLFPLSMLPAFMADGLLSKSKTELLPASVKKQLQN